jgi:hypothetical protein
MGVRVRTMPLRIGFAYNEKPDRRMSLPVPRVPSTIEFAEWDDPSTIAAVAAALPGR